MNFFCERPLSHAASDLVRFDEDSIRQLASSRRMASPEVWIADPDSYEKNGRILRDSESPRMLAYSRKDHVLYATDGCNCCARRVSLQSQELQAFAHENGVRVELLESLASLL